MFEEPAGGWPLALGKAKLTWSADATTVTKTAVPHLVIPPWAGPARRRATSCASTGCSATSRHQWLAPPLSDGRGGSLR